MPSLFERFKTILRWQPFRTSASSRQQGSADVADDYAARVAREQAIFSGQEEVHDLPRIFHYWSNTWLRPQLELFGFSNPDQFFAFYLRKSFEDSTRRPEVRVAKLLVDQGMEDFVLECIDINPDMLERGRSMASEACLESQVVPVEGDFNAWNPQHQYDAIVANQSLHHVLELEALFASIESALLPHGRFVTSDMIGRNGHMRWPEAMAIIHEYWRELPETHRWNVQLKRKEDLHEYWDCSKEGFEGIRAQDILPLLIERFGFEFFFAYGNIIDPFIDRGFGPNFDADSPTDRELIDRIHARDEEELRVGTIKPTHLMAAMRKQPYTGECLHRIGLAPEFCIRHADP